MSDLQKRQLLVATLLPAAGLVLAAVGDWPYGYFILVRWVASAAALEAAVLAYLWRRVWPIPPLAGIAILFNPFAQVELSKDTWQLLDVATGAALVLAAFVVRPPASPVIPRWLRNKKLWVGAGAVVVVLLLGSGALWTLAFLQERRLEEEVRRQTARQVAEDAAIARLEEQCLQEAASRTQYSSEYSRLHEMRTACVGVGNIAKSTIRIVGDGSSVAYRLQVPWLMGPSGRPKLGPGWVRTYDVSGTRSGSYRGPVGSLATQ